MQLYRNTKGVIMLLEFKITNYKSFVNETIFSMYAAPKQTGLDYSLLKEKIKSREIKAIPTSVIYGPNASGKTNLIGAMDTFRSIILRGNINNSEDKSSPNQAANKLELIPNKDLDQKKPVDFSVEFVLSNLIIKYSLSLDLGSFLESEHNRKILGEDLEINGEIIFSRGKKLEFGNFKQIKNYMTKNSLKDTKSAEKIACESLSSQELFLTNGFKLIFSKNLVKIITEWISEKFMIIYRADSMQITKRFSDPQKQTIYVEKTTNNAAKIFGVCSNELGYVVEDDEMVAKLCSLVKTKDKKAFIKADLFESYGTIRFVNIFPLVIKAIKTGGILVVDELDASIHPMAIMSIINVFHNDDINKKKAQLVFNTHNPIFLNSNLLRRDEIKFVERDDDSSESIVYSLSDFGTSGEKGVRKHEDYMKNYFVSQYGAIKDIDFSPVFQEIMTVEEDTNK